MELRVSLRPLKTATHGAAFVLQQFSRGIDAVLTVATVLDPLATVTEKVLAILKFELPQFLPNDVQEFITFLGVSKNINDALVLPTLPQKVRALVGLDSTILGHFLAGQLDKFSNDPFDPQYSEVFAPLFPSLSELANTGNHNLDLAFTQLLDSSARAFINLSAANISFDRYSTALSAGDALSAGLQLEAILYFLQQYNQAVLDIPDEIGNISQLMFQLGVQDSTFDPDALRALQTELDGVPFPLLIEEYLRDLGLSSSDIALLHAALLDLSPDQFSGSLSTNLDGTASILRQVSSPIGSVPEPSTWILFASGLIGLAVWRWKLS